MIRASNLEQTVVMPPWALLNASRHAASPDQRVRGLSGGGAADRFCAWAGRSGRRYIFSVFALGSDAIPLAPKAIALLVRRPATGPRRVMWAERLETEDRAAAVMRAAAGQAGPEASEIHLHVLSVELEARRAAFADLAFPCLNSAGQPEACSASPGRPHHAERHRGRPLPDADIMVASPAKRWTVRA